MEESNQPPRNVDMSGFQFSESRRAKDKRRQLANKFGFEVGDSAKFRVEGVGTGKQANAETRSPHVKKFLRDFEAASWETSSDFVQPYSKADQVGPKKSKRSDPEASITCPACAGAGWHDCSLCDGAKTVPTRIAKGYQD
jgi:hypothetical protein